MSGYRILLVEDHLELAETVGEYLEAHEHTVDYAADGPIGLHLASTETFDAIVLDVMLPGMDGFEVCRRLREEHNLTTPIIHLTARDQLDDKLTGFQTGADDYLVKPFDMPELEARIDAIVRRAQGIAQRYEVGELSLDTQTLEVQREGNALNVSRTGFDILAILMRQHPKVVTRAEIEHQLWGDDPPDSDALRSHLYNLRQAVDRPFEHAMIETLAGRGYRLKVEGEAPVEEAEGSE
ncbi:MAG: response regulator transcription factor [Pseudomonadota bacterium]